MLKDDYTNLKIFNTKYEDNLDLSSLNENLLLCNIIELPLVNFLAASKSNISKGDSSPASLAIDKSINNYLKEAVQIN